VKINVKFEKMNMKKEGISFCLSHAVIIFAYLHTLWCSDRSSWLQIQRSRVRFPAVPHFLRSSGYGTGSTQPREYN
jgi:hypothetical protein